MSKFYCKGYEGEDFDIEKWNQDFENCNQADVPFKSNQALNCTEQCFDCMARIGERRIATRNLIKTFKEKGIQMKNGSKIGPGKSEDRETT